MRARQFFSVWPCQLLASVPRQFPLRKEQDRESRPGHRDHSGDTLEEFDLMKARLCAAFSLLIVITVFAKPRPPGIPYPELTLKTWKFDFPDSVTAEGMGSHTPPTFGSQKAGVDMHSV
jgi:hypothetical protein